MEQAGRDELGFGHLVFPDAHVAANIDGAVRADVLDVANAGGEAAATIGALEKRVPLRCPVQQRVLRPGHQALERWPHRAGALSISLSAPLPRSPVASRLPTTVRWLGSERAGEQERDGGEWKAEGAHATRMSIAMPGVKVAGSLNHCGYSFVSWRYPAARVRAVTLGVRNHTSRGCALAVADDGLARNPCIRVHPSRSAMTSGLASALPLAGTRCLHDRCAGGRLSTRAACLPP